MSFVYKSDGAVCNGRVRGCCHIREDADSRTAYFIRHKALSRTYAIVAYVRHNNNAGSPVFGIPGLLYWPESSQLQMKLQYAWNQRTTHPFLWFKTHGCEWSATSMFVFKSKDWPIDMAEWTTILLIMAFLKALLIWSQERSKGPNRKWHNNNYYTLAICPGCLPTSYHNVRGGLLCEEQRINGCTWYQILACNLILETENLLIKILTKEVTKYFEKYD